MNLKFQLMLLYFNPYVLGVNNSLYFQNSVSVGLKEVNRTELLVGLKFG